MPPKAVRPRGRRRKHRKLDPDPSPDDSLKPSATSPASSPIIDADAGEGPSGTHEPMPGPSERLHEREMQYELDISATAYNIEEKIKHLIRLQIEERQKCYQDYSQKFLTLIVKWNLDTEKVIKQREKLMSLLQVQENLVGKYLVAQKQKMKEFKELCERYLKGLENIEDCHRSVVADEIKNQMAVLEGSAMPESVPEARPGVRKSFMSMLLS